MPPSAPTGWEIAERVASAGSDIAQVVIAVVVVLLTFRANTIQRSGVRAAFRAVLATSLLDALREVSKAALLVRRQFEHYALVPMQRSRVAATIAIQEFNDLVHAVRLKIEDVRDLFPEADGVSVAWESVAGRLDIDDFVGADATLGPEARQSRAHRAKQLFNGFRSRLRRVRDAFEKDACKQG